MQYSVANSYSGLASRVGIKRLIIRRMNNSPCNLTEVEDRSTRKKKAEGRLPSQTKGKRERLLLAAPLHGNVKN